MDPLSGTRQGLCRPRPSTSAPRDGRARERMITLVIVTIILFSVSPVARAQANPPGEYELKAAFLFNFAKFIDWPEGSFAESPISLYDLRCWSGSVWKYSGGRHAGKDDWESSSCNSKIERQIRGSALPDSVREFFRKCAPGRNSWKPAGSKRIARR